MKTKRKNNYLQNTAQKTKYRATWISLKIRGVISGNPERLEVHSKRYEHHFEQSMVLRRYRRVQHNTELKILIHVTWKHEQTEHH